MTTLDVSLRVPPDQAALALERFGEPPEEWLPGEPRRAGEVWNTELRLGRLRRPVRASIGQRWVDGDDAWRSVSWEPVRTPALADSTFAPMVADPRFPTFSGRLVLQVADDHAELVLRGTYEPPGGVAGSVLDGLVLTKVAELSANQFLADIWERLFPIPAKMVT